MLFAAYYLRKNNVYSMAIMTPSKTHLKKKASSRLFVSLTSEIRRKRDIFFHGDSNRVLQNTLNLFSLCSKKIIKKPRLLRTHIGTLPFYWGRMSSSHNYGWLSHVTVLELRIILAVASLLEAQLLSQLSCLPGKRVKHTCWCSHLNQKEKLITAK